MWNVFEDMRSEASLVGNCDRQKLGSELGLLLSSEELDPACGRVPWAVVSRYDELTKAVQWMRKATEGRVNQELVSEPERELYGSDEAEVGDECNYSALEMLTNICVHDGTLDGAKAGRFFIPRKFKG